MRRVELGEDLDLLLDILDLILRTLEVDDLDCNRLLRPFVISVSSEEDTGMQCEKLKNNKNVR